MSSPQEISYLPISHAKAVELDEYFNENEENQANNTGSRSKVDEKKSIIETPEYLEIFKELTMDRPFEGYDSDGDKKVLFLDMDETLIHAQKQNEFGFFDYKFSLYVKEEKYDITFNIRPFCAEFLMAAA